MVGLVVGVLMMISGISGRFGLMDLHSSTALVIAGVVTVSFGLFQLLAANKNETVALKKAEIRVTRK